MQVRFIHTPEHEQGCLACGRPLLLRDFVAISPSGRSADQAKLEVAIRVRCSGCGFEQSSTFPLSEVEPWQLTDPVFQRLVAGAGASLHNHKDFSAAEAVEFRARYWTTLHRCLQQSEREKEGQS